MRLYMLAVLLAFTLTATAPPAASAADVSGQFGKGSKPAKETSANKYVPPANNDRPGGNGRPGRPGHDFDKPGRPGDDNRPGGGGGRGRHDYGFDKPGRTGKHHPGRPSGNRNYYGWGLNCYPYCKGVGLWYGGSDGDDDDYYQGAPQDDYYQDTTQYAQPREPERPFQSGGAFERFDDPRGHPAHDSGYPHYSGDQQSPAQFDIDQYHMMMKAWQ